MITTLNGVNADIQAKYLQLFSEASTALVDANRLEPVYSLAPNFNPDSFETNTYYKKIGDSYELVNSYDEAIGEELYIKTSAITTLEQYFCHIKDLYDLELNSKFLMLPLDEDYFEIDTNTRSITVPNAFKKGVGVAGDVIAETLLFRVDRFFDTMDLYTTDIYVQWEGPDKKQYVSTIEMIDAETYAEEGKIVFGWPLTDKLAATAGTIKFAVRFIKEVDDKIVYSLGTLSASATINPTLTFDIFGAEFDTSIADLFSNAIENSEVSVGPAPKTPVFLADLPVAIYMTVDSDGKASYELRTTTSIADGGDVTYKWYYKADNDARRAYITSGGNYSVSVAYELTKDSVRDESKVYFINSADVGYVRDYTTTNVTELYERYAVLTISGDEANIPEDGKSLVTGLYYVEATNRNNSREKTAKSNVAEMPAPAVPAITESLASAVTLENESAQLKLGVEVEDNAVASHKWEYSIDKEEWAVQDSTTDTLEAKLIGYYKASASATMNLGRANTEEYICKVVDLPVVPEFEEGFKAEEEIKPVSILDNTSIIPAVIAPSGELYSDRIYYYWESDSSTDEDPGVWNAFTNEDVVPNFNMSDAVAGVTIRCVAVNELNGHKAYAYSRVFSLY